MTQIELAKRLGVSQGSVSAWEAGSAQPDVKTLQALSDLFGVSIDSLLGRGENSPTPAPGSKEAGWNVEYPAGVSLRTVPTPPIYQQPTGLSDLDISRIAERVAQMNRDAKTSPILNSREQQLIEDYRLLSTAQKLRVQRLIDVLLDNKFNGD